MNEIHERVALIISTKGMTNAEFAVAIDVQPSNISHIMSGRNKPSLDLVMKILKRFPEIRMEWLLHGKGAMNKDYSLFDQAEAASVQMPEQLLFAMDVKEKEPIDEIISKAGQISEIKPSVAPSIAITNEEEPEIQEPKWENRKIEDKMPQRVLSSKKLEKIVFFYEDQTFKEYFPKDK